MSRAGNIQARLMIHPGDPLFAQVMLLLTGQNGIADSSSFARTVASGGTGTTIDNTNLIFGQPTFLQANGGQLNNSDSTAVGNLVGNGEWCSEMTFIPTSVTGAGNMSNWVDTDISLGGTGPYTVSCHAILGGTSYGLASSALVSLGQQYHVALVRDNSDATWSYVKLYLNGTLVATSSTISKAAAFGSASGSRPIGGLQANGTVAGNFSNYRFTANSARYYANFTPPSAPFPTTQG